MNSVKQWYDKFLKVQIVKFTEELKQALEDKVITEEEAIGLSNR
jgi:hypothetical protein